MATNGKGTTTEHKQMLMKIGSCPITGGVKTRMTKKSFKMACMHWRTRAEGFSRGDGRDFSRICKKCGGRKPRELEYVQVMTVKKWGSYVQAQI